MPIAYSTLLNIDRFGVDGIYGRALGVDEISSMRTVENVILAHKSRANSSELTKWVHDNPEAQQLLSDARKYAIDEGLINGNE